jgi:uncharacterized membrane protein YeaQ/YmgE (transglycosylase-associated protein family)
MGPISWIIFGALAGWVASLLTGTNDRQGCLANVVIGIVGAFIGGLLFGLLGGDVEWGWNLGAFGVAVVGSAVLILGLNVLRGRNT